MKIGQVCVKIAGHEAGKKAVVVAVLDDTFVLVDGNVKRRRCNISHLEPLPEILKISKDAPTDEVQEALKRIGIEKEVKKEEEIKEKVKPARVRKKKVQKEAEKQPKKKKIQKAKKK